MPRLLFDISFTRTQRENVGITRTVRRLLQEFQRSAVGVQPVSCGRGAFRVLQEPEGQLTAPGSESSSLVFRLATSRPGKQALTLLSRLCLGGGCDSAGKRRHCPFVRRRLELRVVARGARCTTARRSGGNHGP
jgi:hypothetical protein